MRWLVILACLFVSGCWDFEGYSSHVYRDPVGSATVCGGHKVKSGEYRSYGHQECLAFSVVDGLSAALAVGRCASPLTVGQLIAFSDLAYNLGSSAFCRSSVARLSRQGRLFEPCQALNKYTTAKGRELKGLIKRRAYYSKICKEMVWPV